MRETEREGGRKRENFPGEKGKVYLLINFSITSRLALSDGALFLHRNVPALYLLRVLISDLVLGNSHKLDYSPSKQKEEKMGEIFFFFSSFNYTEHSAPGILVPLQFVTSELKKKKKVTRSALGIKKKGDLVQGKSPG